MRARVAVPSACETTLLWSVSGFKSTRKATVKLCQACNTISTESKELAKVGKLKTSIKSQENNATCYEASEWSIKSQCVAATTKITSSSLLFDNVLAELSNIKEALGARDAVI